MARKPILIYVLKDPKSGDLQVLDEASFNDLRVDFDAVNTQFYGAITRYTVTLKEEWRQGMQDIVNNASIDDPTRRAYVMWQQYVEISDIPDTVRLEPVVFALLANELEKRVFPSMLGNADFLAAVRSARAAPSNSSPEPTSLPSVSNGESAIAA